MKNIFKGILLFLLTFTFVVTNVFAKDEEPVIASEKTKINLYLFRQAGCPHCADELSYLDKTFKDHKDIINIITYDVTKGNNIKLIEDVSSALKYQINGFPFTLVGDKYMIGFADEIADQLESLIKEGYNNQPKDIVQELLDKNKYENLDMTDLYEAMEQEGIQITSKESKQNNIIPIVVFGIIIVGVGTLIYFSRKK